MVVLGAALLSGCLAAEASLEVGGDGAGTLALEVFPSDEFRDQLGSIDLEDLERLSSTDSADVQISEIGTVGRRGYRVEVGFDDYRVLAAAGVDGVQFAGQDLSLFARFDLEESDGAWAMDAQLRPLQEFSDRLRGLFGLTSVDRAPRIAALGDPARSGHPFERHHPGRRHGPLGVRFHGAGEPRQCAHRSDDADRAGAAADSGTGGHPCCTRSPGDRSRPGRDHQRPGGAVDETARRRFGRRRRSSAGTGWDCSTGGRPERGAGCGGAAAPVADLPTW